MSRLMKAVNSILTQTNKVSQAMSGSLLQRDDSPGDRKARGVRGKTTLSPKNPFAVKESDSGEKQELPKTRIYLKTGEKPPTGVFIQQGPRGGKFYMGDPNARSGDNAETRKLARAIEDAIDAGGFDYRREDDTVHVKPEIKSKQDDESVQDEMGKLADRLDPLHVKKADRKSTRL